MDNADAQTIAPGSTVMVTGATGYVGGRLVPRLLEAGYTVRCIARDVRKLQSRPWANHDHVELHECDIADQQRFAELLHGCDAMYYLVHSMLVSGDDYAKQDRKLATSAARAAEAAAVKRIVYVGGLGETGEDLSRHLASRREVERCLQSTSVPVTVLRAAMIIGSGSASFEILRYLVERLPIMITPRWVRTEVQPIAIRDVLHYLTACLDVSETAGQTLDIGGPEAMTYRALMEEMTRALELPRRLIIPVPVLTPKLSSLWIHLVTPLSAGIARPLAEGLRNRVVCRNDRAHELMPHRRLSVREAIDSAVGQAQGGAIETKWSDAGVIPGDPDWAGGKVFTDQRAINVDADAQHVFQAVCRLGGPNGYYASDWLWALRGMMDRLVGGPGLRRGRRHPEQITYGDALDFWRVTEVQRNRHLELRAEMKLPGIATLAFDIEPTCDDPPQSRLTQTARFKPRGLLGLAYWYMVVPLHGIAFNGMLSGIRRHGEQLQRGNAPALGV